GEDILSNNVRSVAFEIEADPLLKIVLCADTSDISRGKDKQKAILNLNSVFKIVVVDFDPTDHLWKVQWKITDEDVEIVD
ncbi:unnamed protein product, partial [Rotaria sordida]